MCIRYVGVMALLALTACGGGGGSGTVPKVTPSQPVPATGSLTITSVTGTDSAFVMIQGTSQHITGDITLSVADKDYVVSPNSAGQWQWQVSQCDQAFSNGDYQWQVRATGTDGASLEASRQFTVDRPAYMRVHFYRPNQNYEGWGLHLWGDAIAASAATTWSHARLPDCQQAGWVQFWVPLTEANNVFNFIVHQGDLKNTPDDLAVLPSTFGSDVFVLQNDPTLYSSMSEALVALESAGRASERLDLSTVTVMNTPSALPSGWASRAAFMEIYVRGFQDSDGDGQGDLQGLIQRLPYLAALGVEGLWLMPVTESSDNDHGYAVMDYRAIESDYGTLDDFKALLDEAHRLGIGIIIDYVMNHSSSANPLFLDATFSPANDKRAWYNFSSNDPGWGPWGNGWRRSGDGDYYYAPFSAMMPDFNLRHPDVVAFHLNNLRFWLNLGVDGFRFDAVGVLFESDDGQVTINHPDNHPLLAQALQVVNSYDNRYLVCEAPDGPQRYATDTSCGRAFAFGVQHAILQSVLQGALRSEVYSYLNQSSRDRMPLILSNHDHFAGDRPMSFMLSQQGISPANVTPYLKAAASLYLLSSATPFTYYGEEVGQTGAGGDWALRRPMSWRDDPVTAGFTTGTPFRPPVDNVMTNNVLLMQADSESLLSHYEAIYKVRQQHPVLATGQLTLHSAVNAPVMTLTRENDEGQAIVLVNLSNSEQTTRVPRSLNGRYVEALDAHAVTAVEDGASMLSVTLPAHGAAVLLRQ
ncbi:MAG TPA: alpha-amylase family glycosyl hydrolase [Pseudomonadales bacterium]|nr:alpha-amylase family glycosyl hydrolase [Pseudomonadales bacterium]